MPFFFPLYCGVVQQAQLKPETAQKLKAIMPGLTDDQVRGPRHTHTHTHTYLSLMAFLWDADSCMCVLLSSFPVLL